MYENRKGIEMSTGNKLPAVSRFFQTNLYLDKKSKKPCYFSKQKRLPIHNLNFSNLKKNNKLRGYSWGKRQSQTKFGSKLVPKSH